MEAVLERTEVGAAPAKKFRVPLMTVSVVREVHVLSEFKEIDSPGKAAEIVRTMVGADEREHFVVVLLDARYRVKGATVVSVGTLTASLVHPREVFRPAVVAGSAAVIIAHNHPSGEARPSPEDKETTSRLVKAGKLMGIPVLDHVIVTESTFFSFKEAGLLE